MTTEPQEIDNEVTASDEVVTPPPLLPDKVDAKPVSTITFPGMEEFKNEPVLFQEKLKAKYDSLSVAALDQHFQTVQRNILQAGVDLTKQREANSFFDLQLALLYQLRKGQKRLMEAAEEKAKDKPASPAKTKKKVEQESLDDLFS